MLCPVCRVELMIADRQGVEIDYCPQCRGVWLDRGELDKIIERTALSTPSRAVNREDDRRHYDSRDHYQGYRRNDDDHYKKKKKRGGFLEDLFDF